MVVDYHRAQESGEADNDPDDLLGIKGQAARLIEIMRDAIDGEDSKRQDTQDDQREAHSKLSGMRLSIMWFCILEVFFDEGLCNRSRERAAVAGILHDNC